MEFANKRVLTEAVVFGSTVVLVWFGDGLTPWWPLMWLAPLPVLWFALRRSWKAAGLMAFGAWLMGFGSLFSYFRLLGVPVAGWLANFGLLALMVAAGVLLFRALVLRGVVWPGMLALPAIWVSTDWLRNWVTPHGTSADLAYTQLQFLPFLQLASLTGPWGMSFVLLLVPAAAVIAWHLRVQEPQRARLVLCVVGGLLVSILGYGEARLHLGEQRGTVRVGLVAHDASDTDTLPEDATAARLLGEYAEQVELLVSRGAQVVVLPEKITVELDHDVEGVDGIFQPIADATGATVVVGELRISQASGTKLRYNRAQVFQPHARVESYDKEHMLPPFESNLIVGTKKLALSRGDAAWGVAICKDMDFTSMGRAYGRMGAGLMLVPGWDFNVDRTFHGLMSIMRGVEGGFSVARSAKNAYLAVSDDRGRVLGEARTDSAPFATLLLDVPAEHQWTLAQAWGDWFAWVAVAALIFVAGHLMMLLMGRRV